MFVDPRTVDLKVKAQMMIRPDELVKVVRQASCDGELQLQQVRVCACPMSRAFDFRAAGLRKPSFPALVLTPIILPIPPPPHLQAISGVPGTKECFFCDGSGVVDLNAGMTPLEQSQLKEMKPAQSRTDRDAAKADFNEAFLKRDWKALRSAVKRRPSLSLSPRASLSDAVGLNTAVDWFYAEAWVEAKVTSCLHPSLSPPHYTHPYTESRATPCTYLNL